MKRILCALLPQWPIDRFRRGRRERGREDGTKQGTKARRHAGTKGDASAPLVLVRAVASRQVVVAASEQARAHGIRIDMTLAEARAICPGLIDALHEPEKDLHALEGLARWMTRFTPIVAIESGATFGAVKDHGFRAANPPALFLDVTGCERVFGGMGSLLEQIMESMQRLRLHARVAVAPTPGAAWALAHAGQNGSIVSSEDRIRASLGPLPVAALRIDEEARGTLHHLGIETIGQLLDLPRRSLPARFGAALLTRIDQALGRVSEPLTGIAYSAPIESRIDFEGVVDSLEAVWLTFRRLISRIVPELARRGQGARRLELHFFRSYAPTITKTILLSRPSRDAKNLFNLMRCAMETLEDEARKQGGTKGRRGKSRLARMGDEETTPAGFTGIRLCVAVFEPLSEEQIHLLEQDDQDARMELDHLLERLMLRLGEEAVLRPELTESYIPEHAWRGVRGHEISGAKSACRAGPCPAARRPLHLLDVPVEIPVMVSPSHDRDGRPISFTLEGAHHRVVQSIGPERIAGEWWQGHFKTRDYFAVESETAERFWLFRVQETNRWYVHGKFE